MTFLNLMGLNYADRRTFAPEDETGSGVEDAAVKAAAAKAAVDAGDDDAAGQGGDDTAKHAAAVKDSKSGSEDLSAEKAALLKEVMDKKSKLTAAQAALKAFDGVDPAKYRELIAKEQAAEQATLEAKGDFDRVKEMMADAHKREKADLETQKTSMQEQISAKDAVIAELTIGNSFAMSAFIKDQMILSPSKTRKQYGDHFETENGVIVAYDKPKGENGRQKLINGAGEPLGFEDALTQIVEADPDKKTMMKSNAKPGAGSSTTTAKPAKDAGKSGPTGKDRIAANLEGL